MKTKTENPKPGTIGAAWFKILEGNEWKRKTDAQLQAWMRQLFPNRESSEFTNPKRVSTVRSRYNRGLLGPIKQQSQQYDSKGNVLYPRGRPATKKRKPKK